MTESALASRIAIRKSQSRGRRGGSCFGNRRSRFVSTPPAEYGYRQIAARSLEVNNEQRQMVIQKLQEKLRILKGTHERLLGLAFKPEIDTDGRDRDRSARRAPSWYTPAALPNGAHG